MEAKNKKKKEKENGILQLYSFFYLNPYKENIVDHSVENQSKTVPTRSSQFDISEFMTGELNSESTTTTQSIQYCIHVKYIKKNVEH